MSTHRIAQPVCDKCTQIALHHDPLSGQVWCDVCLPLRAVAAPVGDGGIEVELPLSYENRRRLARALRRSVIESIYRNSDLIRAARSRAIDAVRTGARISRDSLFVFRSRWV